jgi:GDPmannose 4,6-dehydratase
MASRKKALITGVTGQDGALLAELLLQKGYEVHGFRRRVSSRHTSRIDHLIDHSNPEIRENFFLHYGDVTDSVSVMRVMEKVCPNEIYNLAAQSHVHVSFDSPEYTANADGLGTLRILEAIKILGLLDKTRFYQASTSELFGKVADAMQNELSSFYPRSPYAVAKLYAHWITVNYREGYGMYACNGLLFNHESPTRGETFVTRKITSSIARMCFQKQEKLRVGNLDSKRDWGHAKDYVEAQWRMLQQPEAEDFVIATGETHSVRDFIDRAFSFIGVKLSWRGSGVDEIGEIAEIDSMKFRDVVAADSIPFCQGDMVVDVDPFFYRPTEVDYLCGDASKAREKLGWQPTYTLQQLIEEMMINDINIAKKF